MEPTLPRFPAPHHPASSGVLRQKETPGDRRGANTLRLPPHLAQAKTSSGQRRE
jgi:hypothetical protein